ncbi:hypothetical protein [Planctomyces sp. SH-PL14]|uniref:hypothetical protein n=1 Tax=Planctomyces sp. SH-PL14 TaxID=1632864 RepID=UPI00078C0947|nr:hypothetical protein [Planctomyces sp. SH-PL14]AMV18889.1 hypothetical protein VT03_13450 [Planctomyces sp. SH-PL14]
MADTTFPTKKTVKGVWLLDEQQLRELDGILDEAFEVMMDIHKATILKNQKEQVAWTEKRYFRNPEEKEKAIEDAKEQEKKRAVEKKRREIRFIGVSDKKCFESFKEAFSSHEMTEEEPTGFKVTMTTWGARLDVTLGTFWFENLSGQIEPDNNKSLSECLVSLGNWADRTRQPKWIHRWRHGYVGLVLGTIFLTTMALLWVVQSGTTTRLTALGKKLEGIMRSGVTDENRNEAIHLLIQRAVNAPVVEYVAEPHTVYRMGLVVAIGAIVVWFLFRPPRNAIALGQGRKIYRRHIRKISLVDRFFVGVVVLGLVPTLVWDWVLRLLQGAGG